MVSDIMFNPSLLGQWQEKNNLDAVILMIITKIVNQMLKEGCFMDNGKHFLFKHIYQIYMNLHYICSGY